MINPLLSLRAGKIFHILLLFCLLKSAPAQIIDDGLEISLRGWVDYASQLGYAAATAETDSYSSPRRFILPPLKFSANTS